MKDRKMKSVAVDHKVIWSTLRESLLEDAVAEHGSDDSSWSRILADEQYQIFVSLGIGERELKVLSLVPDLLKVEFHSLCTLKSLKIKTDRTSSIDDDMVGFLIQNSPSAKVDIIGL